MSYVVCSHCGKKTANYEVFGYCEHCGKSSAGGRTPTYVEELGRQVSTPTRRETSDTPSVRKQGTEAEELARTARGTAAGILFAIAGLNLVCGLIAVVALPGALGIDKQAAPEAVLAVLVVLVGLSVVFAGLGAWALVAPLAPSILGLVIYVVVAFLDLIAAPELVMSGIFVKIVIVVLLIQAINAAVKANAAEEAGRRR